MDKEKLEERIDQLEDQRVDDILMKVNEIYRLLITGNGKESLMITINRNTIARKVMTLLVSGLYIAVIGGVIKLFIG